MEKQKTLKVENGGVEPNGDSNGASNGDSVGGEIGQEEEKKGE